MKSNKKIFAIISLLAILLGFLAIAPTPIQNKSNDFNANNAITYLQVIAKEPHSVYHYEAHEKVRKYLLETTKELVGQENVIERNYLTKSNKNDTSNIQYIENSTQICEENEVDAEYDIRNIVATIPGKNETGILLVAHYDSRGQIVRNGETAYSYGAADDGYGVITLLEIMRYFKENYTSLTNSIYFLFADAEEVHTGGSILEAQNTTLMDKVNFVINVEARGLKGASYMFETSKNNSKVMKMYQKATDKVTYSIAPAVYSVMTNYTDFMNFTAIGKQGLNFSTLDSLEDYHCPQDNYANINVSSIQHYGAQILPIVKEYVSDSTYSNKDYFVGTHDAVFFNFLPNIFVTYSSIFAMILAIILFIATAMLFILPIIKKKTINFKKVLKQLGIFLATLVISILIGFIFSYIIARLCGYPWSLTNVRCEGFKWYFFIFMIALIMLNNKAYTKLNKERSDYQYMLLATLSFLAIMNVVVSIILVGASFIFMLPSFFGLIYAYVLKYVKNKQVRSVVFYLSLFILLAIFTPLVYSLLLALSIGGTLALVFISYLAYSVLLPLKKISD